MARHYSLIRYLRTLLASVLLLAGILFRPISGGAADAAPAAPGTNQRNNSETYTLTKAGAFDASHRQRLVTSFVSHGRATPATFGYLPTNTVAFQEYALDFIVSGR